MTENELPKHGASPDNEMYNGIEQQRILANSASEHAGSAPGSLGSSHDFQNHTSIDTNTLSILREEANSIEDKQSSQERSGAQNLETEPLTSQFPHLSNNPPTSPGPASIRTHADDEDEEPAIPKSFNRSASPTSAFQRNRGAQYEKVGEEGVCKMHKFSLYETASRYYLVGGDIMDHKYRILKIDRTVESGDLSIAEDDIIYTKTEMSQLLNAVDDGNKSTGGLKLKCSTWGLLGFIRFTGSYYMLLITKRSQVAMIGGHYIYQIDGTELVSLTTPSSTRFRLDRNPEEARFVGILNNLDLSRSFYFSYSYDITHTLQYNMRRERETLSQGRPVTTQKQYSAMFIWNHYLLEPAAEVLKNTYDWCLPIIHGFIDQASTNPWSSMINYG